MQQYKVTLTGTTPLLMHHDNLSFNEQIASWRRNPANRELSVSGDDRSPTWSWIASLYHDKKQVGIPADNLMTMLREGGAKVRTGKMSETYKKHTQSGVMIDTVQWTLLVGGKPIPVEPISNLIGQNSFENHLLEVERLGFELLVKRARVGSSKHIRVRPMFREWASVGTMTVLDADISGLTADILQKVLDQAGMLCGLGDWRPSSPRSPGSFGKFTAQIEVM